MPSIWGITPRQSIERECERVGVAKVVSNCIAVLKGTDVDESFLFVIGGPAARTVIEGREGGLDGYWPKTWSLRALLYAWDDAAVPVVLAATTDRSWRVREMAAKVIGRRQLDEGLEALGNIADDPVSRVRSAATRSRQKLTVASPPSVH